MAQASAVRVLDWREAWTATCIGNGEEIERLLRNAAFIGKKRAIGFGEVREWRVEPGEFALERDGALMRTLPAGAIELLGGRIPQGAPAPVGWTPPQWLPSLFLPGWWAGTTVEPAA